jgi:hypothetical protein
MEWIGQFIAAIAKVAPAPLLALGIATGVVLFVPDSLATRLGIDAFRSANRGPIGATFIFSWSYLAAHLLWWLKKFAVNGWTRRRARLVRQGYLHSLTPEEQGYLAPYVHENVNTQHFAMEDGVAGGLVGKGILYRSSSVIDMLEGVPYNMQPWARGYLAEHPNLLMHAVRTTEEERGGYRI